MKFNFWQKIKKPIMCSAPMSGITDASFRFMLAKYGKPDVMFTEFVSCDGLCSDGKERLLKQLIYDKLEKPIVAQLFGSKPENFYQSAKICKDLGFDGIDINMGCPDKSVVKQEAGSSLIKDPSLAGKIIEATKKGAGNLPVSVKTRLGYSQVDMEKWIGYLLKFNLSALTIHGRTKKQGYGGSANWEEIGHVKTLAKEISPETLIIGNGDVKTLDDAHLKAKKYDLDGIMIGRALIANPLFFNKTRQIKDLSIKERFDVLLEHIKIFEEIFKGESRNFSDMKKFYKSYISDFKGASALRFELMKARNGEEIKGTVENFLNELGS
jgi:nifR3 family TIM-barrel protein